MKSEVSYKELSNEWILVRKQILELIEKLKNIEQQLKDKGKEFPVIYDNNWLKKQKYGRYKS